MDAHTALEEWETGPFDGGLEEAARMAHRGFSGAIHAGDDWLFIADGEPVAVVADLDSEPSVGDVDALEDASGETLEAPTPAVARLVPMLALGGEVRGEYFSDDTPVGTVQETLEDGGFTGYVELAENVLSGDYYVVFDDGVAEYVAFIGSTDQLVTGPEAERKTKNEVGIYDVTAVSLPDVALPDPPDDAGSAGGVATGGGSGAAAATGAGAADSPSTSDRSDAPGSADPADSQETTAGVTDADDDIVEGSEGDAADASSQVDDLATETADDPSLDDSVGDVDDEAETSGSDPDVGVGADRDEPLGEEASQPSDRPGPGGDTVTTETEPDASETTGDEASDLSDTGVGTVDHGSDESDTDVADATSGSALSSTDPSSGDTSASGTAGVGGDLDGEVRALRSAVERLEERVADLESAGGDTGPAVRTDGPSLSPTEALSKTTLFVREGTRGGPTLEDGHDGTADRSAVAQNVGLERHTRFDEDGATVEGEPYGTFLEDSQAYRFVEWLTKDLLFEIRNTDSVGAMSKLYDALPEVDRAFFHETVTVSDGEATVELAFDVVVRDRNGAPLFVATLDDSRDPTPSGRIETLVTEASDFCAEDGSLVGAFAVTASYFETDALEVAHEATTSSLLSRGTYRSYVNLTRKNGFHLCLVEARDSSLHLTVPEL